MGKIFGNTIIILMFCSLNYFFYISSNDTYYYRMIEDKNVLFFIFIIFLNIILFMSFFVLKSVLYKMNLLNELRQYEYEIQEIKKDFDTKLSQEINQNNIKDKIIYEQSKLNSMNELITNIAHHWRQPLSVISVIASSMQMYDEKDININQIKDNSKTINEKAQYLSSVIDNFSNKIKDKKEVFRIDFFMDELLCNIDLEKVQIRYEIKEEVSLYLNKTTLLKAVKNILENSKEKLLKRGNKYKIIYIQVDSNDKQLIIKIKDTAGGISKEHISRVFEPYYSTKNKTKDVGLGLYLSYMSITQELKGKIEVENVNFIEELSGEEVRGAQFRMVVPRI